MCFAGYSKPILLFVFFFVSASNTHTSLLARYIVLPFFFKGVTLLYLSFVIKLSIYSVVVGNQGSADSPSVDFPLPYFFLLRYLVPLQWLLLSNVACLYFLATESLLCLDLCPSLRQSHQYGHTLSFYCFATRLCLFPFFVNIFHGKYFIRKTNCNRVISYTHCPLLKY